MKLRSLAAVLAGAVMLGCAAKKADFLTDYQAQQMKLASDYLFEYDYQNVYVYLYRCAGFDKQKINVTLNDLEDALNAAADNCLNEKTHAHQLFIAFYLDNANEENRALDAMAGNLELYGYAPSVKYHTYLLYSLSLKRADEHYLPIHRMHNILMHKLPIDSSTAGRIFYNIERAVETPSDLTRKIEQWQPNLYK